MEKELLEKECVSRRELLKTASCAGAAALLISGLGSKAHAVVSEAKTYPQVRIANLRDIQPGRTIKFDYPLIGRKNLLMDLGCVVEGGVGPNKSIVAYSMFCSHLGCGVDLDWESGNLICECHQTVYDPKRSGRVIEGPAPTHLPMINLDIDNATGDIYATGVAGLIYGLRNNLLDGEEVR
jgi:arsenite oxidase small subunit